MALMDQPYRSLSAAYVIPEFVRDYVYKIVARNRYWIFGKTEKCRAPSADFRSRFLGYDALADEENEFAQTVLKAASETRSLAAKMKSFRVQHAPPPQKRKNQRMRVGWQIEGVELLAGGLVKQNMSFSVFEF